MTDKDSQFWIKDVANRLPHELLPKVQTWSKLLSAITRLKTERNNALIDLKECESQCDALSVKLKQYQKLYWDLESKTN